MNSQKITAFFFFTITVMCDNITATMLTLKKRIPPGKHWSVVLKIEQSVSRAL